MWLADWTRRNWGKFGTYIRIWVKQLVVLAGSVKIRFSRHGDVCQVLLDSKDISAPVKHPEKRNYVSFAASFKMICFSTNKSPLHFGWILCPKSIQTIWTRRGGRLGASPLQCKRLLEMINHFHKSSLQQNNAVYQCKWEDSTSLCYPWQYVAVNHLSNCPFYGYRWKRGWSWPCFDTTLPALLCQSCRSYDNYSIF